jgi:hypothetical protein
MAGKQSPKSILTLALSRKGRGKVHLLATLCSMLFAAFLIFQAERIS